MIGGTCIKLSIVRRFPAGELHGMHNPGLETAHYLVFEFHAPGRSDGTKIGHLISDRSTYDFLEAKSGELEIGVSGHPGIDIDGASPIEIVPSGRLRWTSGDAHFRVPNSPDAPARKLTMSLWPMPLSPGAQLQLLINGWVVFDGPVPSEPLAISLNRFVREKHLTIELKTTPITRYPRDPRDLGVALKQLRLGKSD